MTHKICPETYLPLYTSQSAFLKKRLNQIKELQTETLTKNKNKYFHTYKKYAEQNIISQAGPPICALDNTIELGKYSANSF